MRNRAIHKRDDASSRHFVTNRHHASSCLLPLWRLALILFHPALPLVHLLLTCSRRSISLPRLQRLLREHVMHHPSRLCTFMRWSNEFVPLSCAVPRLSLCSGGVSDPFGGYWRSQLST
ncbi:hypothetical protein PENSPDRAFT_760311 [Peniophora sp. CONT]|nr:hypothetical protein PENSPDRAFT_760311 [Peniophora sp. CONT]